MAIMTMTSNEAIASLREELYGADFTVVDITPASFKLMVSLTGTSGADVEATLSVEAFPATATLASTVGYASAPVYQPPVYQPVSQPPVVYAEAIQVEKQSK